MRVLGGREGMPERLYIGIDGTHNYLIKAPRALKEPGYFKHSQANFARFYWNVFSSTFSPSIFQ